MHIDPNWNQNCKEFESLLWRPATFPETKEGIMLEQNVLLRHTARLEAIGMACRTAHSTWTKVSNVPHYILRSELTFKSEIWDKFLPEF